MEHSVGQSTWCMMALTIDQASSKYQMSNFSHSQWKVLISWWLCCRFATFKCSLFLYKFNSTYRRCFACSSPDIAGMGVRLSWVYHPCLTGGFETLFSQWNIKIIVTKLGVGPDFFHLNQFYGIPTYVINLLAWKFAPAAKINHSLRCQRFHGHLQIAFRDLIPKNWHIFIRVKNMKKLFLWNCRGFFA